MARSLPANILPLALTQGDPSGIGPELTLKAWLKTHDKPDAPPFLAVTNPDRYEPGLNRTYQDLARHYGTTVIPARPYKPRDKAMTSYCTLFGY